MTDSTNRTPPNSEQNAKNPGKNKDPFETYLKSVFDDELSGLFANGLEAGMRHLYAFREYMRGQIVHEGQQREVLGGLIIERIEVKDSEDSETMVKSDFLAGSVTLYIPSKLPSETAGDAEIRKALCASIMTAVMKKANDFCYLDLMQRVPLGERESFATKILGEQNEQKK